MAHRDRWLSALALLGVAAVVLPVWPGLLWVLAPAADGAVWRAGWASGQWPQALATTLTSALVGTGLACALTAAVAMLAYPSPAWARLQRRLPLLLTAMY